MSQYREGSAWSDKNEMRCLLIFMEWKEKEFPHGLRAELCKKMADLPEVGLSEGTISAKVGNFMSVAGVANPSNASTNTVRIYNKYKDYSIPKLKKEIEEMA